MKFGKTALVASAACLAAAPIAAQAADREVAPIIGESEMAANGSVGILVGFALLAAAIFVVASDDDGPVSP